MLALAPVTSFASGKLSFQPGYYLNQKAFGGQVGLSIYEPLSRHYNLFINSWTGYGTQPWEDKPDVTWVTQKLTVETFAMGGKLNLGVGLQVNYAGSKDYFNNSVHAKLAYSLW